MVNLKPGNLGINYNSYTKSFVLYYEVKYRKINMVNKHYVSTTGIISCVTFSTTLSPYAIINFLVSKLNFHLSSFKCHTYLHATKLPL
jgi:hypothetical protein